MLENNFKLIKKNRTLLGVGPMSKNCVIAATDISNKYNFPLMLIASRRQIDSQEMGGGYVNNWNTFEYSNFVKSIDKKKKIILARDHGGPWQNNIEVSRNFNLKQSMESAKKSFEEDIINGFKIIHIDTSIDPIKKKITIDQSLERFFELFEHCNVFARDNKKKIFYEIGTEEQSGSTNTPDELEYTLEKTINFCKKNKFQIPVFVVIQAGTKVLERRNVGSFESPLRIENELPVEIQLPKMIEICNHYKIFMKEHNADYLSEDSLKWHPKIGIHAANIAPEFGVTETKTIINILDEYKLKNFKNEFLEISYNSKKWKKWLLPNTEIDDFQKAVISGHYIFSSSKFLELKKKLKPILKKKGLNLDKQIKNELKKNIARYLRSFNLI